MTVVQLENPPVYCDGLVGSAATDQGVAEFDVRVTKPLGIAHPCGNLHAGLITCYYARFRLHQFAGDLVRVEPLGLVLIQRQGSLESRDPPGAVAVLQACMRRDAL